MVEPMICCENCQEKQAMQHYENLLHDLRTPMSLLYSYLQFVREADDLPPSIRPDVEKAMSRWFSVMQLMDKSGVYEIDALRSMKPVKKELDIVSFISYILDGFMPFAQSKNVSLTFRRNIGERQYVLMDELIFERILMNVLSNAIKFSKKGGSVETLFIYQNDSIVLQVFNTGNADEALLKTALERGVKESSTRNRSGSGIGLHIVNELVKILDGELLLKNDRKNVVITLYLPLNEEGKKRIANDPPLWEGNYIQQHLFDM